MITSIQDGIVARLKEKFGDIQIYTEQVEQDLIHPCFLVSCEKTTNEQFLGKQYNRSYLFSIIYIPQSGTNARAECYEIQDSLFTALEYIYIGQDLQRGTEMEGEFTDTGLSFHVKFQMFVYETTENDSMETLAVENQVR